MGVCTLVTKVGDEVMCAYVHVIVGFIPCVSIQNYFSFCLQKNCGGAASSQDPLPRQKGKCYTGIQYCVPNFNFFFIQQSVDLSMKCICMHGRNIL